MITASAPAKIILFGEHAVVYNQPAIAIPISSIRTQAHILEQDDGKFQIFAENLQETIDENQPQHPLWQLCHRFFSHFDLPMPNVKITINSNIPIASGLGSGASVSTAVGRVLSKKMGVSVSNEELNQFVYEIEKIHHGTPSGIDNTVIVYEQPIYFIRDTPIDFFEVSGRYHFIVADTGIPALTKPAVTDVKQLTVNQPDQTHHTIVKIGKIATQAKQVLESGNMHLLGELMTKNHMLLQSLTVSSHHLDHLVTSALDAGALGAKLSGGGRGGNMITLVTENARPRVNEALLKAGAIRTIFTTLEG